MSGSWPNGEMGQNVPAEDPVCVKRGVQTKLLDIRDLGSGRPGLLDLGF